VLHQNYISGEWLHSGEAVSNVNPSNTHDVIADYAQASADDARQAIAAASAAQPAWSRSSIQLRHDILKTVGDEILARKSELGTLLSREEGKVLADGIGEVVRAGQIFHFFAGECLRLSGAFAAVIWISTLIVASEKRASAQGFAAGCFLKTPASQAAAL
jgi:acyl-CoA reductase-like NAD-dependent aldehyde dehydrogenase